MKNTLFLLIAFLSSLSALAQITVTNTTFPVSGDTLRYARADNQNLPNMLTPPGGDQTWDFSALIPNENFEEIYKPASQGQYAAQFPAADFVVITPSGEEYYNVTNSTLEQLGYSSNTLLGYSFNAVYVYDPPRVERKVPLNFFDIHQSSSNVTNPFALADLPAELVANLPPGVNIDSLRLRINHQTLDVVDAWGTLTIPGPTPYPLFPVLRQKRTEYTTTALDVHTFLGWINVPVSSIDPGITNYVGTDTTKFYRFINDVAKEEIAVARLNSEESAVESVRYKRVFEAPTSVTDLPTTEKASVKAMPNLTTGLVSFECTNLPEGAYTLWLSDAIGRIAWSNTYQLTSDQYINIDISFLEKGAYFYRLEERNGLRAGSGKLVVVKE